VLVKCEVFSVIVGGIHIG